jgi:hypothetical protein
MRNRSLLVSLALGIAFLPINAFSESSKLVKVDLDVDSTVMVRAELGQADWYYWIDATACVCWVGRKDAGQGGMSSTFDCKRLKAHPKLTEHLGKCGDDGARQVASEKAPAPAETKTAEAGDKTEKN